MWYGLVCESSNPKLRIRKNSFQSTQLLLNFILFDPPKSNLAQPSPKTKQPRVINPPTHPEWDQGSHLVPPPVGLGAASVPLTAVIAWRRRSNGNMSKTMRGDTVRWTAPSEHSYLCRFYVATRCRKTPGNLSRLIGRNELDHGSQGREEMWQPLWHKFTKSFDFPDMTNWEITGSHNIKTFGTMDILGINFDIYTTNIYTLDIYLYHKHSSFPH